MHPPYVPHLSAERCLPQQHLAVTHQLATARPTYVFIINWPGVYGPSSGWHLMVSVFLESIMGGYFSDLIWHAQTVFACSTSKEKRRSYSICSQKPKKQYRASSLQITSPLINHQCWHHTYSCSCSLHILSVTVCINPLQVAAEICISGGSHESSLVSLPMYDVCIKASRVKHQCFHLVSACNQESSCCN